MKSQLQVIVDHWSVREFVCTEVNCPGQTETRYNHFNGTYQEASKAGWTWQWKAKYVGFYRVDKCPLCSAIQRES